MSEKRNRHARLKYASACLFAALLILSISTTSISLITDRTTPFGGKDRPIDQIPIIDGTYVHNVGDLQMNITNWGIIGSMPNSNYPMRDVPSAQFPAGSGVEYLYAAGIWVGAERSGLPSVSTGFPEDEFRPLKDATGTIYETFEGDLRGGHLPRIADDDRDGRSNEDILNGRDDDGDGKIDEDFIALGNQMFSCEYTDNQPVIRLIWPEHEPLEVLVHQETFQWSEEVYGKFIGARYTITNNGFHNLENTYVGLYADVDAGPRDGGTYHMDDQVGFWSGEWCATRGYGEIPVDISIAYVYDNDGDEGRTEGYFGIAVLGHAPAYQEGNAALFPSFLLNSFRVFQGLLPYANGGDPTNDFERYEAMSERGTAENTERPGDYRFLISIGPFSQISFGQSIYIDFAFVSGNSLEDLLDNTAIAQFLYDGIYYDLDGDPETGVIGRESPMTGPLVKWDPDPCDYLDEKIDIERGDTLWCNLDCFTEKTRWYSDLCYSSSDLEPEDFMTGVDGKEHNLHWIVGGAPPPPHIRVVPGENSVTVHWDNLSEVTPDVLHGIYDFEGYQVWRADDWHRPLGSSRENGPAADLWSLLEQRDIVNGVLPDIDFRSPFASGGWQYEPLQRMDDLEGIIISFEESLIYAPLDTVPCPPGLTQNECDTLEALARERLGLEGGKKYYKFVDDSAKNGLPYFYSVVTYDHELLDGTPDRQGRFTSPSSNFAYVEARSRAREADGFDPKEVFVVPNPVTAENMSPWELGPTNDDASGLKLELRNLPACRSTIRIYTVSGDLVKVIDHDGSDGNGTAPWNLVSRNGQDVTSGVYIFAVEPRDGRFEKVIGKFVIIR